MSLAEQRRHYRQNHRSVGCKITHMIGVPLIVLSLPAIFFLGWQWALGAFVLGWMFQLAGHALFEKNQPVFLSQPSNPVTYLYAIVFVLEEWVQLLSGKGLSDCVD